MLFRSKMIYESITYKTIVLHHTKMIQEACLIPESIVHAIIENFKVVEVNNDGVSKEVAAPLFLSYCVNC